MGQKITIEPITRIEGHARVTINVDDAGQVEHAYLHVDQFRGFEKFSQGRMFFEMPSITPRICGICPVSHHLASAKACDAILGVDIPLFGFLLSTSFWISSAVTLSPAGQPSITTPTQLP